MVLSGFTTVRETSIPSINVDEPVFRSFNDQSADAQGSGGNPNIITVITASPHGAEIGDTVYFKGSASSYDVIAATITSVPQDDELTFEITTNTVTLLITGVLIVYDSYELNEDTPTNLSVFVHMDVQIGTASQLKITKDNQNYYPIANGELVVGTIFKSQPIQLGNKFNIRLSIAQTTPLLANLLLEE